MKIKTSEATGTVLDRMVAKALGYTLQDPIRGTNEQARGLSVPFTMFEVNYQQTPELVNERCWVSPVTVTRFGVNRAWGATAESIDFTGSDGRKASGSVDLFYFDEAEAELEVSGAMNGYAEGFEPSTDWSQGGPIIEREKIELRYHDVIVAGIWYRDGIGSDECSHKAIGPTPLIAAMRCLCASKLGDEVEVPDELIDDEPQPCPTCGEDGGTSCGAIDCDY